MATPRYYHGSIVKYRDEYFRVDSTSAEGIVHEYDGGSWRFVGTPTNFTYMLTPVAPPETEPPDHLVRVAAHKDWRIGSATPRDGDPLYDVPEAELEAIHSSYIAQSTKSSAGGNSDGGTAVDGTNIERS